MALRLKIRKEIKLTLEEDGFTQEEIKEQLNDLVEEELKARERQSQQEFEARERDKERESQERIRIQEIETERLNNEKEIELRKLELDNNINEIHNEGQSELKEPVIMKRC